MKVGKWVLAIAAIGAWASASADCTYPKAPESIPNGSTASQDEMLAAMSTFKQYNADVTAYLACLETETADKVREAGGSTATIVQVKSMQAKKHNAAFGELQKLAEKFNDQVRTFKARAKA
jgi:hypothetical protein